MFTEVKTSAVSELRALAASYGVPKHEIDAWIYRWVDELSVWKIIPDVAIERAQAPNFQEFVLNSARGEIATELGKAVFAVVPQRTSHGYYGMELSVNAGILRVDPR